VPLTFRVETSGLWLQPQSTKADAVLLTPAGFQNATKKTARFPRAARLLRHADFERVYKQGRRHFFGVHDGILLGEAGGWARQDADKDAGGGARATRAAGGIYRGAGAGRAVQRNRIKRRLREAVRMTLPAAGVRRMW